MKQVATRFVFAIVLFVAAAFAWREGRRLGAEADARERLATLRFVGMDGAKARYWRGEYQRLTALPSPAGDRDPDPEMLLVAANAAYRNAQHDAGSRQAQVQQLDVLLQSYSSVLKSDRFVPDAAYNYEFVARLRETTGRGGKTSTAGSARAANPPEPRAVDLPTGPTLHGRPGGPPPGTKGEEFEIITPMEFGDRESQPEPNAGGRPLRKG
jgi:hypothetical protein